MSRVCLRPILKFISFTLLNVFFFNFMKAKESGVFIPDRLFKVVLVGNSSVGKTSLLRSFCEGRFHTSTTATVGENRDVVCTARFS